MRKYSLAICMVLCAALSCTKMIRVERDAYIQNQAFYEGKNILIETNLEDVVTQYPLYNGKNIEIVAPISHYGEWGLAGWYLTLERDGGKLRCYEENYKYYLPWKALYLVRWAKSEKGEVKARGKLRKDGMELCALAYKSLTVNTNAVIVDYDYTHSYGSYGGIFYRR